ncbi:hypothetical protein ACG95P_04140 [Acinetobacter guillouiae]|uniref:hypothetical protein n=1 Tax=Acinetobacter guillouiae TaxID=106649 RepID=UPI003AF5010F
MSKQTNNKFQLLVQHFGSRDMEKYNTAVVMGYQVLRFSTEQVKSGLAVQQIEMIVG